MIKIDTNLFVLCYNANMYKILNGSNFKFYQTENSDTTLLIFTGIGGSVDGYNEKYVKIAHNIMKKYNASVFVISVESWNVFDSILNEAKYFIDMYYNKLNIKNYSVYLMGTSAGATIILSQNYNWLNVKKVLAINPVIQYNYNKLINGIVKSTAITTVIMGEKDPSYLYLPMLNNKNKLLSCVILKNVNHQFTEHFDTFLGLPEKYLFET